MSQPKTASFDFAPVIAHIIEHHGFDDYKTPMARPAGLNDAYDVPQHPAGITYGSAAFEMIRGKKDIPQELITANRKSVVDAIHIFMPPEHTGRFLHQFFAGNFLKSRMMHMVLRQMPLPSRPMLYTHVKPLDDELTMKLDAPERIRTDRNQYTKQELEMTLDVCKKVPALYITVIAYSVAFQEYLMQLNETIQKNPALTDEQKERSENITWELRRNWANENFTQFLLPALALHYKKNHGDRLGEPPTEKDFSDGMRWADKAGIFKNHMEGPKGDVKQMTCPARGILLRSSRSIDMPEGHQVTASAEGTGLYHIYRAVEQLIATDKNAQRDAQSVSVAIDALQR
jgi:hypothetical protein